MGRLNTQGTRTQCQHCGYIWLTTSTRDVTSCPSCGWRVRIRDSSQSSTAHSRELLTERSRDLI